MDWYSQQYLTQSATQSYQTFHWLKLVQQVLQRWIEHVQIWLWYHVSSACSNKPIIDPPHPPTIQLSAYWYTQSVHWGSLAGW